ncbi:MAG: hypothetical protein QM703_23290 [Gemmatales bacterium]
MPSIPLRPRTWRRMIVSACIMSGLMLSFVAAQQPAPQKAVPLPQNIRVMGGAQIIVNGQVFGGQPDPSKEAGNQRVKLPVDPLRPPKDRRSQAVHRNAGLAERRQDIAVAVECDRRQLPSGKRRR